MFKYLFFFVCILFISLDATADQCAFINKNTRDIAYNLLKSTETYLDFCPSCGDIAPKEFKINDLYYKNIEYSENGEQFYQIYINGRPVDIAYVYINGKNLGMQSDCTPNGQRIQYVPEYIDDYFTGKWFLDTEEQNLYQ